MKVWTLVGTMGVRAAHRSRQDARRPARKRADGGPPNVAQAYRPIGAEDRFQSCFRLRRGKPLDRTVVPA
jgi:hypothetical protein